MKKSLIALSAALLAASPASVGAQQIAYPNEASRVLAACIANKTTGEDRINTARWMASSIAASASLSDIVTVNPVAKEENDRIMGALFTRLMTQDCREETRVLMQSRDQNGIESAGGRLGQVAMQELMSDPAVMASLMAYIRYADAEAIEKLAR